MYLKRTLLRPLLSIAAVSSLLLLWHNCSQNDAPTSPQRHSEVTDYAVFGPGQMSAQLSTQPVTTTNSDVQADQHPSLPLGELYATEQQQLIINSALLDVINFYLLAPDFAGQLQPLANYLKLHLPELAARQALQIAQQYQVYIGEHDQLLAAQNLSATTSDLNRISSWQQQRLRLRQRLLGEQLQQAWYQNEEAQLQQALDELRLAQTMPQPELAATESAELLQHTRAMQAVVIKACTSLHAAR